MYGIDEDTLLEVFCVYLSVMCCQCWGYGKYPGRFYGEYGEFEWILYSSTPMRGDNFNYFCTTASLAPVTIGHLGVEEPHADFKLLQTPLSKL